jgi:hypothetical protein
MSLDLALAKRRLMVMAVIDAICAVVAVAAAIGAFAYGVTWLTGVFVGALVVGFAAQIWFIAGLRRTNKGA